MQNNETQKVENQLWEIVRFTLLSLIIVIPIRLFIIQPFIVNGDSMLPTFTNKEYLIVDQISYNFDSPQRGDVIVFRYPKEPSRFFIKRIIGLPGETIVINDGLITIQNIEYPEGFKLEEDYISSQTKENREVILGNEEFYVMGDNRPESSDSRFWGPLQKNFITGRVLLRLFPLRRKSMLPGNHRHLYETNANLDVN